MLTNSELFYRTAERFQNDRKALTDEYNAKMKGLERHRGSEYFTEESKKASKEFSEKLGALQQEARKTLYIALESMEKANNSRGVIAPTPEQINILTALKMRDKLTRAELDRAANPLECCNGYSSKRRQIDRIRREYESTTAARRRPEYCGNRWKYDA